MAYIDKGAIAVDNEDGDITDKITVTGVSAVDVNTAGTYNVVYSVTDDNGASATATRVVEVVPSTGYDLEMHVKAGAGFHVGVTKKTGGKMYVSLDGGNTYELYDTNDIIPAGDNIRLMGKDITGVEFNKGSSSSKQHNSPITELHIVKAYSLIALEHFVRESTELTKVTTAHKNVFPNVLNAFSAFSGCTKLVKIGEINYANMTSVRRIFNGCSTLACIEGTIDFQSSTDSVEAFANSRLLTKPNATQQASILGGTAWTNTTPCP